MAKVITPRSEDYSRWYTDVVLQSQMADYSPVKGCMVIRPLGYAVWEAMQRELDARFRATGHQNAYFPLFIPESFLHREAEHVEGFAPECAVVTHGGGKKLEEPLVVRPTSETIIYEMYSKWIRSYRDLPVLINQWANVVRWEMRTRLFLRTTEFLWQEGHTAHATDGEAEAEARQMLDVYATFAEEWMAVPVLKGLKTEKEKFAGAVRTYAIEALMQDNRALQAGTSHHLGQNFAKAFDLKFQDEAGAWQHAWNTSWGVSTRLVGAIVMAHGDDNGLVLPPRLAPIQVAIVPIWKGSDPKDAILAAARDVRDRLVRAGISLTLDDRESLSPGFKFNEWELLGVPLRIEIGPKDLEKGSVMTVRRHDRGKQPVALEAIAERVPGLLDDVQQALFSAARARRDAATRSVDSYDELRATVEGPGGFVLAPWCGSTACETKVHDETKATIRVLAFDQPDEAGRCVVCGQPSHKRVHFAKAY
jgi:prolyl-tRNA synthetase